MQGPGVFLEPQMLLPTGLGVFPVSRVGGSGVSPRAVRAGSYMRYSHLDYAEQHLGGSKDAALFSLPPRALDNAHKVKEHALRGLRICRLGLGSLELLTIRIRCRSMPMKGTRPNEGMYTIKLSIFSCVAGSCVESIYMFRVQGLGSKFVTCSRSLRGSMGLCQSTSSVTSGCS